jgi:hypothetical protein
MSDKVLTTTEILAAATSLLETSGYRAVGSSTLGDWQRTDARVFEDPYSVVAVFAFETWAELSSGWRDAQALLVELLSTHFQVSEPKAWEGYQVLLTPALVPRAEYATAASIRADTGHVRKLVATGEELLSISDIERAMRPVLPLQAEPTLEEPLSALDLLPDVMASRGVPRATVEAAIDAFLKQESIAERLNAERENTA